MKNRKKFYKAPRYIFRKLNIVRILKNYNDINSFIDVGCGAGELACSLSQSGIKGMGTDFSKDAIVQAKAIQAERNISSKQLEFVEGDAFKFTNQKFDLVICCEVLEHVKDDGKLLKGLNKLSSKYVMISVPAKQRLYDTSDAEVGHFRRYEKEDLLKLLRDSDLEVLDFVAYGYPFTNIVRLLRKSLFKIKSLSSKNKNMESKSKESGINPIKLPAYLSKIDLEKVALPFYYFTCLFNKTNLSEGYLVFCQKKSNFK